MKRLILITFVTVLSMQCFSQELKRKGQLGIAMQALNDSIANVHQVKPNKGIFILEVVPNSTAEKIGLKNEDILITINQKATNSIQDVVTNLQHIRSGGPIQLEWLHNGVLKKKKGYMLPRPKETSEIADVFYESVSYEGHHLRTILHTPKQIENPPVVFFLQGYVCQTVEALSEHNPVKKMIDSWIKSGYAVFRVEKPGMGDSDCEKGCMELNFNEEHQAFDKAYIHLAKDHRIDTNNIFLFGHSMGGVIAPLLAKEHQPRGVITYGTVVKSWFEYLQELTRIQGEYFNSPFEEIENDVRRSTPFWYQLLVEQKSNYAILQDDSIKTLLKSQDLLDDFESGYFTNRHYSFWASLNQINLYKAWKEVQCDVLALYGEFDIQALNETHIKTIAKIVNSSNPGKGNWAIIPKTDHGFIEFNSMQENVSTLNSGAYMNAVVNSYSPRVVVKTIEWMNQIKKK